MFYLVLGLNFFCLYILFFFISGMEGEHYFAHVDRDDVRRQETGFDSEGNPETIFPRSTSRTEGRLLKVSRRQVQQLGNALRRFVRRCRVHFAAAGKVQSCRSDRSAGREQLESLEGDGIGRREDSSLRFQEKRGRCLSAALHSSWIPGR